MKLHGFSSPYNFSFMITLGHDLKLVELELDVIVYDNSPDHLYESIKLDPSLFKHSCIDWYNFIVTVRPVFTHQKAFKIVEINNFYNSSNY